MNKTAKKVTTWMASGFIVLSLFQYQLMHKVAEKYGIEPEVNDIDFFLKKGIALVFWSTVIYFVVAAFNKEKKATEDPPAQ